MLASLDAIEPDSFHVAERTTRVDVVALLTLARFVVAMTAGADESLPPPPRAPSKTRDAAMPAGPPDGAGDAIRHCCELLTALRERECSRSDWPDSELGRAVAAAENLLTLATDAFPFGSRWNIARLPEPSVVPATIKRGGQSDAQLWSTVFHLASMHTRAKALLDLGLLAEA